MIILRPTCMPLIHVLECDGPRHKDHRRGEGFYRLCTDNHQRCNETFFPQDQPYDPALVDWSEPCWEIYQNHDGSIEVHACRPTLREIMQGDMHGTYGSVIKISWPCRPILRNALRLARRLCKADPIRGLIVSERDLVGIVVIETDIPVYLNAKSDGTAGNGTKDHG
jgi:hypothetical protein